MNPFPKCPLPFFNETKWCMKTDNYKPFNQSNGYKTFFDYPTGCKWNILLTYRRHSQRPYNVQEMFCSWSVNTIIQRHEVIGSQFENLTARMHLFMFYHFNSHIFNFVVARRCQMEVRVMTKNPRVQSIRNRTISSS